MHCKQCTSTKVACSTGLGFVLLLCGIIVAKAGASTPTTSNSLVSCPGVDPTSTIGLLNCTAACQQAVCTALETFFHSTYNPTNTALRSWRDREGWDNLLSQSCAQILASSTASGSPAYCNWYGVTCCNGGQAPPLAAWLPPGETCVVLNSVVELNLPVNGLSGSLTDAALQQSFRQLHSCGMARVSLSGNALSGSLSDFWGELVNLTTLNLARNYITGTLPDAIRNLTKLAELQLDRNTMMGTIPEWLTELPLQWLALNRLRGRNEDGREGLIGTLPGSIGNLQLLGILGLGSNSLTGSLPANLCNSPIAILDIHGNQIRGQVSQLLGCYRLYFLDIHSNKFTGVLPDVPTWPWYGLSVMDLSDNDIEGPIPMAFYRTPVIDTVNMASNRLNGTISSAIGRMQMIISLNLANNQLTGPIPADLGTVTNLRAVTLSNNNMSCTGDGDDDDSYRCTSEQMLPCFLQLTPVTVPRPDASNMACPVVVWKSHDIAVQDCSGTGVTQLGYQADDLADLGITGQLWQLDPSYYHYASCKCLGGYQAVWSNNSTVLKCEPSQGSVLAPWFIPTAVIATVIGICLLGAVGLLVWLRVTILLRWKWQRERDLLKYRQKGVPNGGPATIVVTDVEGYSEFMQHNAAVTTQAMATHNAILRKAVTAHAGHVIEQEGDSWSVAFHRAVDAVAFCLQVQQALQKGQWPSKLGGPAVVKSERFASNKTDVSETGPASDEEYVKQVSNLSAEAGGSAAGLAGTRGGSQQDVGVDRTRSSSNLKASTGGSSRSESVRRMFSGLLGRIGSKRHSSGAVTVGTASQRSSSVGHSPADGIAGRATASSLGESVASRMGSLTQSKQQQQWISAEPSVSADRESSAVEMASKTGRTGSVTWLIHGKGTSRKIDNAKVRGLKVRMGVVSGMLAPNSDISVSPLFELAKAVSDLGSGGQVLTDHSTAMAVRDWLTILGGIDHKGYNDQLVLQATRAEVRKQARTHFLGLLSALFRSPLSIVSSERDPLMLDMGQLWVPSLVSCMEAVTTTRTLDTTNKHNASPLATLLGRKSNLPFAPGQKPLLHLLGGNAAIASAAVAAVHGSEAASNSSLGLQLFCVVPRPLHARCKIWKGKLNLTSATQFIKKGYFDAPGAATSDLGPSGGLLDGDRPQLPPVTMVFAVVEGGKVLVRKKARVAAIVHTVLVRTMQALLLSLPDGYLCREQEAVLKYMVAFREPARAAEWCLMLQEVLHHIPWSREVTEGFASLTASPTASSSGARATSSSAGLGIRPRLKIGVAEGVPDDMYPDHLGRADYFGTSVNLAARIMSAAANPGQIAMSIETAQGLFSTWRYEAEMGFYKGAAAVQLLQPGSCQDGDVECHFSLSGLQTTPKTEPPAADHRSDLATDNLAAAGNIRDNLDLTLPNSHNSQPGHLLEQQQQQPNSRAELQTNRSDVPTQGGENGLTGLQLEPIACTLLSSEGAVVSGTRSPAALGPDNDGAVLAISLPGGDGSDKRILLISAHHTGTYAFKGCGAMDMVCLTSDALPVESYAKSAVPSKGAKGTLIMSSDGPVVGLQDCPVTMPNIMQEFRKAWASMGADASQAGSPEPGLPSTRFVDENPLNGSVRYRSVLSGKEQHGAVK